MLFSAVRLQDLTALNRTSVELKYDGKREAGQRNPSLNRTIVELKFKEAHPARQEARLS